MDGERRFSIDTSLRDLFLLDPEVVFLNHGSFGACPVPVFETYQGWQRELERQPVAFFRRSDALLDEARAKLGEYVNARADDLVFVPNATTGINTAARSLLLQPGDEILTTDHEYGALDYTWEFMCRKTGARYVRYAIPLPVPTADELVESFWRAVTPRTKVIYLSHVTSPTALILPAAAICRRAHDAGILTVIDGAHGPGHIPVDLDALGVDFYAGNCHKWLSAPKGAGFLYARSEHHTRIEPLVISWGYTDGASFVQQNQYQGTRDLAAFLSVPSAIEFQQTHDWDSVRAHCHTLAVETRRRITTLTGLPAITPDTSDWFMQMFTAPLPPCDPAELKSRLYDEYRIEVPIVTWQDRPYIRVSFQGYNTQADADRLIAALGELLTK